MKVLLLFPKLESRNVRSFMYPTTTLCEVNLFVGPVAESIEQKLTANLVPAHLEIINESYMHSVPKGSETHFKV